MSGATALSGASATSTGSPGSSFVRVTMAVPRRRMPRREAASRDKSITRTRFGGWRSLMVTTTLSPVSCIVTRTRVPSGRLECAAVSKVSLKTSPLLVRRPL